jgi:hypothetical protein
MAKKLFILIADGGDGSYYPQFTFDEQWIAKQEQKYADGKIGYPDLGCDYDGDGFHYETLTVPNECTLESLGIGADCADSDSE